MVTAEQAKTSNSLNSLLVLLAFINMSLGNISDDTKSEKVKVLSKAVQGAAVELASFCIVIRNHLAKNEGENLEDLSEIHSNFIVVFYGLAFRLSNLKKVLNEGEDSSIVLSINVDGEHILESDSSFFIFENEVSRLHDIDLEIDSVNAYLKNQSGLEDHTRADYLKFFKSQEILVKNKEKRVKGNSIIRGAFIGVLENVIKTFSVRIDNIQYLGIENAINFGDKAYQERPLDFYIPFFGQEIVDLCHKLKK